MEENVSADEPEIIVDALSPNEIAYLFINNGEWSQQTCNY